MAMLNMLRLPLAFLPMGLAKLTETKVAAERIQAFLLSPNRADYVPRGPNSKNEDAIIIKDVTVQFPKPESKAAPSNSRPSQSGSEAARAASRSSIDKKPEGKGKEKAAKPDYTALFAPKPQEDFMTGLSLRVPRGKLTLVVGPTGCGKSTLI